MYTRFVDKNQHGNFRGKVLFFWGGGVNSFSHDVVDPCRGDPGALSQGSG